MLRTTDSPSSATTRRGKAGDAEAAFTSLLAEVSRRGYYGSVALTLVVQDGHIQQVKVATERIVR